LKTSNGRGRSCDSAKWTCGSTGRVGPRDAGDYDGRICRLNRA
jgi:hypothetical protein